MIRRNWLIRCTIIATTLILFFVCFHLMVSKGSVEYIEASAQDTLPTSQLKENLIWTILTDESNNINSNELTQPPHNTNTLSSARENNTNSSIVSVVSDVLHEEYVSSTTVAAASDDTVLNERTLEGLKSILNCKNRSFEPLVRQRGEYWVLYNFVKAEHGPLGCHETVTYTTHGDYTFMENLVPLIKKWENPISVAIHAPGTDMDGTVSTIRFLRDCTESDLIKIYVTFHVFFSNTHIPKQIPNMTELLQESYNCSLPVPYKVNVSSLYKSQKNLFYPVNVGRNVARESALTHYVLASDIELYPSPMLAERFLNMIARSEPPLNNTNPRIFPISIFEVEHNQSIPSDKTELMAMLKKGVAIPFHKRMCSGCHKLPKGEEWMKTNETQHFSVFHIGKRLGQFVHWEPIFIGTNAEPFYDERLSWEGKSDKMTQGYVLCVKDYDFMILNNAFLVHRPGIKTTTKDYKRNTFVRKTNQLIRSSILPELKILYGTKQGCAT